MAIENKMLMMGRHVQSATFWAGTVSEPKQRRAMTRADLMAAIEIAGRARREGWALPHGACLLHCYACWAARGGQGPISYVEYPDPDIGDYRDLDDDVRRGVVTALFTLELADDLVLRVLDRRVVIGRAVRVGRDCRIGDGVRLGDGVQLWRGVQVMSRSVVGNNTEIFEDARIGAGCSIEDCVRIGLAATIGDGCRVGRFALVADRAVVAPGVVVPDRAHVLLA